MYLGLIQNIALLVALCTLYSLVSRFLQDRKVWLRICKGLLFGGVAVAGMMMPFRYSPGIFYDGRSIVLSMAGLFGGLTVAGISSLIASAYRIALGGTGVYAGVATIVSCSLVGLIFRRLYDNQPERLSIPMLYILGLIAHIVMLSCQLVFLPWPAGVTVIKHIWLPVMALYPVGTVLMGLLLSVEERRSKAEQELVQSRDLLLKSQSIGKVGSWELDLVTNQLRWSDEVFRIFGINPENFACTYEAFLECVHPDDRKAVDSAYTRSVEEGEEGYEIEHRIVRPDTGEIRIVYEKCIHYKNSAGSVVRSVGFVQDMTERKRAEEKIQAQLAELQRWYSLMLGREERIIKLKQEVNELLRQAGQPIRYPSVGDNPKTNVEEESNSDE